MADETVKNLSSQPTTLSGKDLHDDGSVDPVYHAKARVLNQALQEIGMGKYQVRVSLYLASSAPSLYQLSGSYLPSQVLDGFRE